MRHESKSRAWSENLWSIQRAQIVIQATDHALRALRDLIINVKLYIKFYLLQFLVKIKSATEK